MMRQFKNRHQAGQELAEKLMHYKDDTNAVIIGLPRGGVVTAFAIAQKLNLPLDIIVPRKIGVPNQPELAAGAITQDGDFVWNPSVLKSFHLKKEDLIDVIAKEQQEAQRRLTLYRGNRLPLNLQDKTVIIVDDGIATGATMRAAIETAKKHGAQKIIVAVPAAPVDTLAEIEQEVDKVFPILVARMFMGVGSFYEEFAPTPDNEVIDLLHQAKSFGVQENIA